MKTCTKCLVIKPLECFYRDKHRPDGLLIYCKTCRRLMQQRWYTANKVSHKRATVQITRHLRVRNQEFIFQYLKNNSCVDCEFSDPRALEFDHTDPSTKLYNIADMTRGFSLKTIQAEIDKCEVRCANCHNIKTAIQRNYYTNRLREE